MPRPSKKTELIPMDKPSPLPEDYADYGSALIQFGNIMWQKNNKMLSDGGEGTKESLPLSLVQVQYLNMRMAGITMLEACKALKISPAYPLLWEEGEEKNLYCYCVDAIKQIQARAAEDSLWGTVSKDPESCKGNLIMFGMKSRMPEYKDNAPTTTVPIQVNLTVDGIPYKADTRMVGEDDA